MIAKESSRKEAEKKIIVHCHCTFFSFSSGAAVVVFVSLVFPSQACWRLQSLTQALAEFVQQDELVHSISSRISPLSDRHFICSGKLQPESTLQRNE